MHHFLVELQNGAHAHMLCGFHFTKFNVNQISQQLYVSQDVICNK